MSGYDRYDAGRWICQKPSGKCQGLFSVRGERRTCPLAEKCLTNKDFRGQLEFLWPTGINYRLLIREHPDWSRQHEKRVNAARWAFDHEGQLEYYRQYRAKNRDKLNARAREKYSPAISSLVPDYIPRGLKPLPTPPCGADHRNCPYDGDCRYPDWEDEIYRKGEAKRRASKKYRLKRRERMKSDPEYAEHIRAKARTDSAAYRQRRRAIIDSKRDNRERQNS